METKTSILIALVCVVVVTCVISGLKWVWMRPKKLENWLRQQGISGPSYRLFFGDLKDFNSMGEIAMEQPMNSFSSDCFARIEPFRHQLYTKYGKPNFMWMGPIPMVHITKPELIKDVFTRYHDFQKPRFNPLFNKLLPGLVGYEGDKWATHRKIINPAFHMEKLKLMLPAFCESCTEMMNKWGEMVGETTGSTEIDVWPYLITLSADVISRAAFGSNYQEGQKIFELLKEQIDLSLIILRQVYMPGRRYIPTPTNRRLNKVDSDIKTLLEKIIIERKEAMKANEASKNDLLGILLDSNLKETQEVTLNNQNKKLGMNLQEVIEECKLFYLAGQETTSVLLVWTLILLSKHQDWQAQAREEVFQTFGNNIPDFEGISHLKTVTMILHEVLRLFPPVTHITRIMKKDTKLGELLLPANSLLSLQTFYVHHDKDIWGEDAEEFKPERFSEGVSKATHGNLAFFPFGGGPRICIGEKFAITEAKMALSMILQQFSMELSPTYSHAPMTVLFLQPQHGAQIILHKL